MPKFLALLLLFQTFGGTTQTKGIAAAEGKHYVALSWTASATPGVTYNLYRSQVPGGPYTRIQSGVMGTSGNDTNVTPGQTYYYVATAYNGSESVYSNEASATIPSP